MDIVRIGGVSTELHSADEVGAKAANLARMAALGLPVPPAFVLPVKLCAAIIDKNAHAERYLRDGLQQGIEFLESATGKRFGDRRQPLLVSVRSGAARSMPGMLDTVLNVGCTSAAVQGLIRSTGRPRLAWDCRRRFLESYTETVLGLDPGPFAAHLAELATSEGVASDRELDSEALERLAADEQALVEDRDDGWLEDATAQLASAARAVYRSWMSERAQSYRHLQKLDHLQGTAVTVQAMVFGNGGLSSGAGVAFSRDPSTGRATADDRPCARRPGRRRRFGPPDARYGRDDRPLSADDGRRNRRYSQTARKGIRRRPGCRVHHRGWQIVGSPDALREADAARGATDRHRPRARRTDHAAASAGSNCRHRSCRACAGFPGLGRKAGHLPESAPQAASRRDARRSLPKAPSGFRPRATR